MKKKGLKIQADEIIWEIIIPDTFSTNELKTGEYFSFTFTNNKIDIKSTCSFKIIALYKNETSMTNF